MVRTPCCERMGMKKGPWTPEEDQILISFIKTYGHGNWRALPRKAGLLRCGKSCRLRWTNYLRPDIKRGNFSEEEEGIIIKLHQVLGNRWSAIAARLPGRTDNEIKNYWHTHLKRRLKQTLGTSNPDIMGISHSIETNKIRSTDDATNSIAPAYYSSQLRFRGLVAPISLQTNSWNFSSDQQKIKEVEEEASTITRSERNRNICLPMKGVMNIIQSADTDNPKVPHQFSESEEGSIINLVNGDNSKANNDMAFWYNLFIRAGESQNSN